MMASLRTDSPLARRVASSFLNFLRTVEPASDVDLESIEVVSECLQEIFKLHSAEENEHEPSSLLVDLFSSYEANKGLANKDLQHGKASSSILVAGTDQLATDGDLSKADSLDLEGEDVSVAGLSTDEILSRFCQALEKVHFFKEPLTGDDEHAQFVEVKRVLRDGLLELRNYDSQPTDINALAEALKVRGNQAIQSKLYMDAIMFYSCAIALCETNAVYYCNRAAAFTYIDKFPEAIADCKKSIGIDPSYSKGYSRLGMAYYAQGNYRDAIDFGFMKALQLDPNNNSIHENIQAADRKLREISEGIELNEQAQEADGNSQESHDQGTSSTNGNGAQRFAFASNLPPDIASVVANIAGNVYPIPPGAAGNVLGGSVNFNFGDNVPEQVTGAWHSMMEMLSSQAGQRNPEHDHAPC